MRSEVRAWSARVIEHLVQSHPLGAQTAAYLQRKQTAIGFSRQKGSAARWTLTGRILFNSCLYSPQTPPDDPFVLCTLVHEVHHLSQGWLKALSVYGELEAWQIGFRYYYEITRQPVPPELSELLFLPVVYDRAVLRRARLLMQNYAGKEYRIDLYPLFPLHHEIAWHLGLRRLDKDGV